jgi:hypothetical protein
MRNWLEKPKKNTFEEELEVEGRIILKLLLEKLDGSGIDSAGSGKE